jgi:hypothetical protein
MIRSDIPIALPYADYIDYDDALGLDMDQAAGDLGFFIVPFQCQVVLAGAVVTETCAGGTTTPVVAFDKRPTAGSDTSRGAADIGNFVLSTTAAGKVMYDKVAVGTVLAPGDEIVVELVTAATGTSKAGHIRPFLLVEYLPETLANLADMVETA